MEEEGGREREIFLALFFVGFSSRRKSSAFARKI